MKKLFAALLCVILVFALLPVSAMAEEAPALVAPESGNYFEKPFVAKVYPHEYIRALTIMAAPETGHGTVGTILTGSSVFVLAEQDGYFFVVTIRGEKGWVWHQWFDYDKKAVGEKAETAENAYLYPTVTATGDVLTFPAEDEYLEEAETKTVRTQWTCGSIYLMPMPEGGHGNLGIVGCEEEVQILAEKDGFYFFETADGRYGWNSPDWFE